MLDRDVFYEVMRDSVQSLLNKRGVYVTLELTEVTKYNGQKLKALQIGGKDMQPRPCIYLADLYDRYYTGYPLDHIALEVANIFECSRNSELNLMQFTRFEISKDRLTIRLIGIEGNEEWLKDKVWKPMGDFAKVCCLLYMDPKEGYIVSNVTEVYLKDWQMSPEEVYEIAMENLKKKRVVFRSLQVMAGVDPKELEDDPDECFVFTNEDKRLGAAMIAIPELMDSVSEALDSDLYVIPSSVHEVIIMRAHAGADLEDLKRKYMEVNKEAVAIKDKLSDHIQYYDRMKKELRRA